MKKNKNLARTYVWVLLLSAVAANSAYASECKVVNTELDGSTFLCGESPVGLCSDGQVKSGLLKGEKELVYTAAAFAAGLWTEPTTSLSYSADAVFKTDQGNLFLSQLGVVDSVRRVFTEINRITGGTEAFEGASGELFISGRNASSNLETTFESKVTGKVCLASDTGPDELEN